jgi:periplasmic nitrate reductase NapE
MESNTTDTSMSLPVVEKKSERNVFLFLTILLAPILAVAIVGSYGFIIWLYQLFAGPPTS